MKAYMGESIGTFVLVFAGCGSAVLAAGHIGFGGVSAAFGLALLAMIYTVGPISGCHLNPAVTLGMVLSRKFDVKRAPGYVIAQIVGSILAAATLYAIASGTGHFDAVASGFASNGYGTRSPDGYNVSSAFIIEMVLTALLVLTILGATDFAAPVGFAGIAIGLCLTLIHLVSIPVTNTSVNPARSIGPALFAGPVAIGQLWLFIIAPLLGGAIAAAIYAVIRPIDPVAQLSTRRATQSLPTEQEQRLATVIAVTPPSLDPEADRVGH